MRLAGVLVGLQGMAGIGVGLTILVRAVAAGAPSGHLVAETGFFLLLGGAVAVAGWGLIGGRRWARSPAIVTQLLLLPVVYSLLGPSQQLLLGGLALCYVVATFLLLISEPARAWSMGDDDQPPPGRP